MALVNPGQIDRNRLAFILDASNNTLPVHALAGSNGGVAVILHSDTGGCLMTRQAPHWYDVSTAANAADTLLKSGNITLMGILVTTLGTAATLIYDSASAASGTVIAAIPASAAVGTFIPIVVTASTGLYLKGNGSNAGFAYFYRANA